MVSPSGDLLAGDLDLWQWDAARDDFVYTAQPFEPLNEDEARALGGGGMAREEFDAVIGPEKFRGLLCQVTGWASTLTGVPEVAIHGNNPQFVAASDVVYRRVMESPIGARILSLPTRDIVDLLIVGGFALPYVAGVIKGRKAKAAAAVGASEGFKGSAEA